MRRRKRWRSRTALPDYETTAKLTLMVCRLEAMRFKPVTLLLGLRQIETCPDGILLPVVRRYFFARGRP